VGRPMLMHGRKTSGRSGRWSTACSTVGVGVRGGLVAIEYGPRFRRADWGRQAAEITLNPSVRWRIEAPRGLERLRADLSAIQLLGVNIQHATREAGVTLPRPDGPVLLRFAGAASDVTIHRPAGTAARRPLNNSRSLPPGAGWAGRLVVQGVARTDRKLLDAAALVGHLVPEGSMFAFLATHRGELFPDQEFADLFPSSLGRPSLPAPVAAAVLTLQTLHDLSDAETAEAARCDLRWKVATGWPWTTPGFTPPR